MANRIDDGVQPTAHTAVQAMIVRAQQAADQTGKAVGVHYNLAADQVSLVEITPDTPKEVTFLRVATPADGMTIAAAGTAPEAAGDGSPSEVKTAPA